MMLPIFLYPMSGLERAELEEPSRKVDETTQPLQAASINNT